MDSSLGFQQHLLESYSTADMVRYFFASPTVSASSLRTFLLSDDLIAKQIGAETLADELAAIDLARQLHLRIPNVKRVVEIHDVAYVITDRIHGAGLEESWGQISWFTTLRLAFQLRRYVRAMRTRTSPTAGSLIRGLQYVPGRKKTSEFRTRDSRRAFVPSTPTTLVFTHQDLAPRNLLVDKDSNLWVVDWESSGWYPKYFESVSMQNFRVSANWNRMARLRWWIFSWISTGIYGKEREALGVVRSRSARFPLGRRDEILPPGARFDAVHLRKPDM